MNAELKASGFSVHHSAFRISHAAAAAASVLNFN
jgi:hypothetical protein